MLYKKKLLINYLRIFDCLVYIKIVKKGKKMILRNRKQKLIRYNLTEIYCVQNSVTDKINSYRNVKFNKKKICKKIIIEKRLMKNKNKIRRIEMKKKKEMKIENKED